MNNKDNSSIVGGRGRGNTQNTLQCDTSLSNNLRRPYVSLPEIQNQQDLLKNSSPSSSSVTGERGRGNKQKLLQCDTSLSNNLRRPYVHPPEIQLDLMKNSSPSSSTSITEMKVAAPQSVLSADAKEFIPRYLDQKRTFEPGPSGVATPLQFDLHNSGAQSSVNSENIHVAAEPQLKYVYHPLIVQVNDFVVKLSMKPHKFDQIANKMTSIMSTKATDQEIMKEAVSVIFEQGIGDPNFRFNGGRLCQHLCKYVSQQYEGLSFKNLLLQRCQEEFNCRNYYLQTGSSRLCGFTLFLSDIYGNVLTATSTPLQKLGEALCTLLLLLLSVQSDTTLKCVVQALKGIGSIIDRGEAIEFNAVMDKVKDVALKAKIPDYIRSQLLSVVELRAANWGKRRDEIIPSSELQPARVGTVYYGADGSIERIEEDAFDSSASDSEESQFGMPIETEMDSEIALAFEEFLQSQNNTQ